MRAIDHPQCLFQRVVEWVAGGGKIGDSGSPVIGILTRPVGSVAGSAGPEGNIGLGSGSRFGVGSTAAGNSFEVPSAGDCSLARGAA